MGFNSSPTGFTEYDATVYLTPLGVDKLYNGGFSDGIKFFSLGDHDVDYSCYDELTFSYNVNSGGYYMNVSGATVDPSNGYILNLRGTVDRGNIIDTQTLNLNYSSMPAHILRSVNDMVVTDALATAENFVTVYKLSGADKIFDKPIVLGSRNMWRSTLTPNANSSEGFLYYRPPTEAVQDYINTVEPTIGTVTTGATDYVPFPGISVTNGKRAFTEIQYMYFLNNTKDHMFVDSIALKNILPVSHTVTATNIDENYSSEFVRVQHQLIWTAIKDGQDYVDGAISIYIPQHIYNQSRLMIFPYEIVRYGVSFEIINPGSAIAHWCGQTSNNATTSEGQYEFGVELTTKPEIYSSNTYSTMMNVVVKVKSSGYNVSTYVPPVPVVKYE